VTFMFYVESPILTKPTRFLTPRYVAADGSGYLRSIDRVGTDANLGQPVPGGGGGAGRGPAGTRIEWVPLKTDANGNYFLRRIPPAQYYVGVEFPPGYTPNPNG